PLTVNFNEAVTGISTTSATVTTADGLGNPVAGTWACTDKSNAPTPCTTGHVRHANFTPTGGFSAYSAFNGFHLHLNPNHVLDITDFTGNPFTQNIIQFL